jgi:hypothetical protein
VRLLLFDPLAVPSELEVLAADREAAIVLIAPWHERDAQSLVERLGVPVYTPLLDTAEDLMKKYGISGEQTGNGSPDLNLAPARKHGPGAPVHARRPAPVRSRRVPGAGVERHRALDRWPPCGHLRRNARRLRPGSRDHPRWLREAVTREQLVEGLRPLLKLPIEHVLAMHGGPNDRAALERALS